MNNVLLYGTQNVSASPSLGLNLSVTGGILSGTVGASANAKLFANLLVNISSSGMVAFTTTQGNSLSQVAASSDVGASGTVLSPGASATLTYNGKLAYDSGLVQSKLKSGSQYMVTVTGNQGASANSTVTAK